MRILDLYLRCWTQEQIAEETETPQQTVGDVLKRITENGSIAKIGKDFKPQLYDIWNFAKITNETQHPLHM